MTSVAPMAGWVDDYLARIGVTRPASADLQALRDLQAAHLLAVPFENLSIHLGEPIVLDQAALVTKVARMHRGGFCYELNGAFAGLLTALGFGVSLLSARVFGAGEKPGPPFDHMTLRVDLAEPWLADVGFGRFATRPLRLGFPGDQPDPGHPRQRHPPRIPPGRRGDRLTIWLPRLLGVGPVLGELRHDASVPTGRA